MASAPAAKVGFTKRVQDAIDKFIDRKNKDAPTYISQGKLPVSIKTNSASELWHTRYNAIADFLVVDIVKRYIEAKHKAAKAKLNNAFGWLEDDASDATETFVYDNVTLTRKVNSPQERLDRGMLLTHLMTVEKMSFDKAQGIIKASTKDTTSPVHLIPATTAE